MSKSVEDFDINCAKSSDNAIGEEVAEEVVVLSDSHNHVSDAQKGGQTCHKSILEVTDSDIDEEMAKDNNNLQNETIDGFDFDTPEEFLLYHSRAGNIKVVEKLVLLAKKNEIDLDLNCKGKQKSNYGWTPIQLAAYFGHKSVIQELIQNNADVNVVNESGDTALHKAAYTGRDDIVVLLVSSNADVFIINGDGLTPRELARKESVKRILLAAEEADLKRREERFLSAARSGDVDTMKSLLADTNYPLNINCKDVSGNTALHCSAYRGQKEVAVFLLQSGIDVTVKNNRGQLAHTLAPNVQLKQLLHEVQPISAQIVGLKNKTVARFEGALLKKGRFFGWRLIWAVLERGVFSFFGRRADAATGIRRKGFKYLESSICEVVDGGDDTQFVIYFSDRSRALLSVPTRVSSAPTVDRHKWVNAINDHIHYGTNFIKQGMRCFDDSDDEESTDLMPQSAVQSMIQTACAHTSILEKHIKALLQLSEDITSAEKQLSSVNSNHCGQSGDQSLDTGAGESRARTTNIIESTLPSIKFHLNLILESSENATSSLSHCMAVLTHQDDIRQILLKQEQEKVRVLEDALHVLAREHHDLEQSLVTNSAHHLYHSPPRTHSICMSDATDADEFFDAFDDGDDNTDKTLTQSSDDLNASSYHTLTADYMTPLSSVADLCPPQPQVTEDECEGHTKYRSRLPAVMVPRDEVSLWSILKHCIGKELSKITFPVVFNEPISFLQRMAEILEYSHHLNIADQSPDPIERMENICAYIVSTGSSNWMRLNKPFNPLLGETYEYEMEELGVRCVLEQVSHHPPVSAWHVESPHFELHGTICPKLKFWGKSIEVRPEGTVTLRLKSNNDVYTWRAVNCCVHNIIVGKLWFEQYGLMEVKDHSNGLKAQLNFKAAGWFGKDLHRFEGFIYSSGKEKLRFVYGKWTDYLKTAGADDYDEYMRVHSQKFRVPDKPSNESSTPRRVMSKLNSLTRQLTGGAVGSEPTHNETADNNESSGVPPEVANGGEIPKSDSSHSLDIPNSRILWQVNPRPEHSPQYYHFTHFAMSLNHMSDRLASCLPPTDSRRRPDVRKLEEGDLEMAAQEKNRLEEKQREVRRLRKKRREVWDPIWFKFEQNEITKEEDWMYRGCYWERDYNKCPDIF